MQEREEVTPIPEEVTPTREDVVQYSSPGGPKAPADIEIQGKFGPPEDSYRRRKTGPAFPEDDETRRS